MTGIRFEIEGTGATVAATELLEIPGLSGHVENVDGEPTRSIPELLELSIAIVGLTGGVLGIAESIHTWYERCKSSNEPKQTLEKVVLEGRNGKRIILSKASVEDIRAILEEKA
jgi:hypothetical protein